MDAANRGGGEDNITVVLFQLDSVGEQPQEEPTVDDDDEDTLSGLDPVPVVDTASLPEATEPDRARPPAVAAPAPDRPARLRSPSSRPGGSRAERRQTMSLRNRELANLLAVGVLTAIGFASVYIARSSLVDATSLTYAGIFMGLYLVAHLVARASFRGPTRCCCRSPRCSRRSASP